MNITDSEYNYLVECMARDLATLLVEKRGVNMKDALNLLYNSETYAAIKKPATGLYYQSPLYVYDYLDKEITFGRMQ